MKQEEKVYCAQGLEKPKRMHIQQHELLGRGGQGKVYKANVNMLSQSFVDKYARVEFKEMEALEKCNAQYNEFYLSQKLQHPNIIEYQYFVHRYDINRDRYEFHTIMELMEGKDMENFFIQMKSRQRSQQEILRKARSMGL